MSGALKPGDAFDNGKYTIEGYISEGGAAVVYRAYHNDLRVRVALKILHAEHESDGEHQLRLLQEAHVAFKIRHPNLLQIYDCSQRAGCPPYISMELLEGHDFCDVLAQGPVRVTDAIRYVMQACLGVGALHAEGITHRDIKPDNLFLTRLGLVKVLDLGTVKANRDKPISGDEFTCGTLQYMAPEQIRKHGRVDVRTDIYALGAFLYELIVGRGLHATARLQWPSEDVLRELILRDAPTPIPELIRKFPPYLWAVIAKAIAKNPDERYSCIPEFYVALERALEAFRAEFPANAFIDDAPTDPSGLPLPLHAVLSSLGTARYEVSTAITSSNLRPASNGRVIPELDGDATIPDAMPVRREEIADVASRVFEKSRRVVLPAVGLVAVLPLAAFLLGWPREATRLAQALPAVTSEPVAAPTVKGDQSSHGQAGSGEVRVTSAQGGVELLNQEAQKVPQEATPKLVRLPPLNRVMRPEGRPPIAAIHEPNWDKIGTAYGALKLKSMP